MKQIFALLLTLSLLLSLGVTALADSRTETVDITYRDIRIVVNGTEIVPTDVNGERVEPFILGGSTYLPVRAVAGALGLAVAWDDASSTISLSTGAEPSYGLESPTLSLMETHQVTITYRDIQLCIDGVTITPTNVAGKSVEPFILDGSTYLPVRAVADALGLDVDWNGSTSTVTLTGQVGSPITYLLSRRVTTVGFASGGLDVSASTEELYTYDEQGNLLTHAMTSPGYSAVNSYTYDDRGNLLSYQLISSDGEASAGCRYVYDDRGNVLREELTVGEDTAVTLYTYDDDDNMLREELYENGSAYRIDKRYENGLLTESVSLLDGIITDTTTYTYDKAGHCLTETVTYPDGTKHSTVYTYTDNGLLRSETCTGPDSSYTHTYRYTDSGLLASERYSSGDYEYRFFYDYDERGNCVRMSYDDAEGENYEFLYTYNAENQLTKLVYTDKAAPEENYTQALSYDVQGNLCATVVTYPDGTQESSSYLYTYDDAGNILSAETDIAGVRTVICCEYIPFTAK